MSKEEARLSALEAVHLASTGALEAAVAAAQAAEEVRVYGPGGYDVYAAAMARVNPTSHILEPES